MSCTASPAHSTAAALFWQELCLPLRKSRTDLASLSRGPEKEGPGPTFLMGHAEASPMHCAFLLPPMCGSSRSWHRAEPPRTHFSSLLSGTVISVVPSPWALQGACCFSSWRGAGDGCGESQGIPSGAWGNLSGLDRRVVTDRSVVTAVLAALSEPFVSPLCTGPVLSVSHVAAPCCGLCPMWHRPSLLLAISVKYQCQRQDFALFHKHVLPTEAFLCLIPVPP